MEEAENGSKKFLDIRYNISGNDTFDSAAWVRSILGYQTSDHAVTYTVTYTILLLLGLCGNLSTIFVVIMAQRKRGWTGIDAYLINLATADILLSVSGVPLEIYTYWQQYPWIFGWFVCSGSAFVCETCLYASILTIVAFTFERYLAVKDPIKTFRSFSLRRTAKVIGGVWLLAIINAVPYAYFNSTICFYLIPMLILAVLYIHIGFLLRKDLGRRVAEATAKSVHPPLANLDRRKDSALHEGKEASEGRKRTVKVLCEYLIIPVAIVANFFICYGFFHVQRLMFAIVPDWYAEHYTALREWNTSFYPISGFLYHANPVLDPIFYSMMSRRFQSFYRRIFCCPLVRPTKTHYDSTKSRFSSFTRQLSQQLSKTSMARRTSVPVISPDNAPRILSTLHPPEKVNNGHPSLLSMNSPTPNDCIADIHASSPKTKELQFLLHESDTQL